MAPLLPKPAARPGLFLDLRQHDPAPSVARGAQLPLHWWPWPLPPPQLRRRQPFPAPGPTDSGGAGDGPLPGGFQIERRRPHYPHRRKPRHAIPICGIDELASVAMASILRVQQAATAPLCPAANQAISSTMAQEDLELNWTANPAPSCWRCSGWGGYKRGQ